MTPLRRWLDGALARRLAFWAITITVGTLALGLMAGVSVTAWSTRQQADLEARRSVERLAASLGVRLGDIQASLAALAGGSLVINGLSDAQSLDDTLRPLLAEHLLRQRYGATLQLCDVFQHSIAGSVPAARATAAGSPRGDTTSCGDPGRFEHALSSGRASVAIGDAAGAADLVWVMPITLPATGTREGALVARIPLAAVLRATTGPQMPSVGLRAGGRLLLWRPEGAPQAQQVSADVPLPGGMAAPEPSGLQVIQAVEPVVISWGRIVGGYAVAALLLAGLAAVAAVTMGRRLTTPYEQIGELASSDRAAQPGAWDEHAGRTDEAGQLARRLRDLTVRLARQIEELDSARRAADAANRAKTEFLATMSHELRTPLNAVTGLAALALEADDAERRAHLEQLQRSAARLRLLVDEVLDLGRIESGRLELAPTACALRDVIVAVRDATLPAAAAKALPLVVDVAAVVPPVVRADPQRLVQVLTNLVANAVKFTEHGEVRLEVAPEGTQLRFRVADTGIGIDAADLARIFEPFQQADASTARRYGGSGLGLAICRRLVALMGGDIEASSVRGQGSVFTVRVPLIADRLAEPPAPATDAALALRERLGGRAVLVVEDDTVNRLLTRAMVERLGLVAVEARGGDEALAVLAAQRDQVGLVLMDCHMPGVDGYEATRRIRADATLAQLPIVACTADVLTEDRDSCRAAGMDDYVSKPIDRDTLVAAMNRCLDARRQAATEAPA